MTKAEIEQMETITHIMFNGRKELQKQQLYKYKINKLEVELKLASDRTKEIIEEVKELQEEDDKDA